MNSGDQYCMSHNYEILWVTIDHVSRNIDSDFNLVIWQTYQDRQITIGQIIFKDIKF